MYCTQCSYNNPVTAKTCRNCELDLLNTAGDSRPADLLYAGWWLRFLAAFLDLLLLGAWIILIVLSIAGLIAYSGRDSIISNSMALPLFSWAIFAMSLAYFVLMESGLHGATFGKRWMHIKVMHASGSSLTPARSLARLIAAVFSNALLMSGFLLQPFTARKQAVHDLLAGTLVVRTNENTRISIMASLLVLFFTLMIPVLAMLATAGLPFFQQHIMQVQLENGIQDGKKATLAVSRFYRLNGRVPVDIGEAGGQLGLSPHVAGVAINQQNGEIVVAFSEAVRKGIRNKHLIFTPTLQADQSINWKCHSADIEARILPATCQ